MGKGLDYTVKALDAFSWLSGNAYSFCPKCGKKCYTTGMPEGNDMVYYSAIRKTVGRVPIVGGKVSRLIADKSVKPTFAFYCHKCDYEWKTKHPNG